MKLLTDKKKIIINDDFPYNLRLELRVVKWLQNKMERIEVLLKSNYNKGNEARIQHKLDFAENGQ